jgi:hypothetical protein
MESSFTLIKGNSSAYRIQVDSYPMDQRSPNRVAAWRTSMHKHNQ